MLPTHLAVEPFIAYFVYSFAVGAGWALGNWVVHRILH